MQSDLNELINSDLHKGQTISFVCHASTVSEPTDDELVQYIKDL